LLDAKHGEYDGKKGKKLAVNVILFTNFIPPYRVPLFKALEKRLGRLSIFIFTPMEPNRSWPVQWERLEVKVQRSFTFRSIWRHESGFREPFSVYVPYDTFWLLWRRRPKLVIFGDFGARGLQATVYRLLNPDSRLIMWAMLSEHTERGRGRVREMLRRWIFQRVDAAIVKGESGARYVRRFGVREESIFLAPDTIDVASFATERTVDTPGTNHRLLYVGQLIERKGLQPVLSTLSEWAERNPDHTLELWFAGEGPLRQVLESSSLPPNLSLRFLGPVPYVELPQVYADATMLVFPTLADEWGLVVNEAMACGLPVLGSIYSQAVEELVEDGTNGWVFRPDSREATFNALDRALRTPPEVLQSMGESARDEVSKLAPDVVAQRVVAACHYALRHPFDA